MIRTFFIILTFGLLVLSFVAYKKPTPTREGKELSASAPAREDKGQRASAPSGEILSVKESNALFFEAPPKKNIDFNKGKWSEVTKKARQDNKPIFAMVCASWCSNCARMKQDVFSDPQVAEFMNENFVSTMIDADEFRSNIRASNWGVKAVPTMVFLTPNKKVIHKATGFRGGTQFLEEAKRALNGSTH